VINESSTARSVAFAIMGAPLTRLIITSLV
jgi:hypothetical protein